MLPDSFSLFPSFLPFQKTFLLEALFFSLKPLSRMLPESFFSFFQAFFLFRKVFSLSDASDKFSFFRAFFLSENLSFGSPIFQF